MGSKLYLISEEDILNVINTVLYNHDYITKEMYLKCGNPKYITSLPGDLRSTDPNELNKRLLAIEDALSTREKILQDADSRISKKVKENERLGKRVEKSISNMEKAQDKIAEESDKIVNNINKANFEDKINNWSDESIEDGGEYIKNNAMTSFNNFRKAHNDFFSKDLTANNVEEYKQSLDDYEQAISDFNTMVIDSVHDGMGMFKKGDIKYTEGCFNNIRRISKQIDVYVDEGGKVSSDVESIESNNQDIDYITKQSTGVSKEIDILLDEYERTHNKYVENGGTPKSSPNPQMMIDVGAKEGDSFTFLPPNYNKYMV